MSDYEYQSTISIGKCFSAIIYSLIALALLLIPIAGTPAYLTMPIVGDESIFSFHELMLEYFISLVNPSNQIINVITIALKYGTYAYLIIPTANVIFALLLILFRAELLRKLFNLISLFFGLAMLIIMLSQLIIVVGFVGQLVSQIFSANFDIQFKVLLFPTIIFISSSIICRKQFKWFRPE